MKVDVHQPSDFSQEQNFVVKTVLDEEKTRLLLRQVPKAYKTQINDILLTALVLAYGDVTGDYTISFYLEGHGREPIHKDIDLSRTVGWFTSIFPITLSIEKTKEINLAIKSVKTQLAKIPSRGISYFLLRYLVQEEKVLKKRLEPKIIFNYLGQIDQITRKSSILKIASESCGSYSHPKNKRSYPLEISAYIKGGVFEITWSVDRDNELQKIEKLAVKYIERLEEIINYCVQSGNFGYIPLDFPLANIDQQALDKVFGKIKEIEDIYPLSPLQSGLLFHALSDVESDAYIVQTLYTFKGDVISANLKNTLQEVSNHYDAFKTGFVWDDISEPLQFVLRKIELEWKEEDWSLLSKEDQDIKTQELLREDRNLKFDLKTPPLSRWYFIKISKNKSYLLWTHHHILLDGWSGAIILPQLLKVYQQLTENNDLHLLQRLPYKNFIKYLSDIDKEKEKKFWQQYLDKAEPCYLSNRLLSFQQESSKSYERCQFMFSEETTSKIKEQAKNLKVTLNTLLQGAWSILLKRYTQSDKVIFGVTVSGRNIDLEGINESIGLFINTLPLKVQVRDDQKLRSFFEELQCNMADVNNFSYTSLARIKSYCVQKHQDLFNTLLIFENFPTAQQYDNSIKSVQIEKTEAFETIEYALNIAIKADEQLHFNVGFQTKFFDIKGIEKIIKDLMDILNSIVLGKEDKVRDVAEKISTEELKNIQFWNKTDCVLLDKISPQIYEQVANSYPNKICARFLEKYLTYNELRQKANKLANYFIKNGLVKKKPVGICLERSLDNVVVMLAIWKANGCYVPLDPGSPYERLRYMIEDAGIDFLISSSILSEKFREKGLPVEDIDDLWEKSTNESIETPPCTADGSSLAYIIYTSGSTGVPKGVMVEHRSLMNFLVSMAKNPGIKKEDKFLAVTTPAFDISGLEIWLPLLNGAELIIAPQINSTSGKNLSEMIETFGITMMQATPATWQMLLDDGWSEKKTKMKILSGGDILPSQVALKLLANKNELWNMYGPTETTIWSTTVQILSNSVISIGKPIDNTEIYMLDEQMRAVGVGIPGEIYIGGVGLARGYINNPELTKEKFVENSFSEGKYSRLYKTGDLGRYLEDGNIQYLGRIDNQIKLRGYRIEPGEIETYIERHEGVKSCVVLVKKDNKGHESLVAYVVLEEKGKHGEHLAEKKTEQLRQELRQKLPEYMVPNYFIEVGELPLNANGKIDRKKLPELDAVGRRKEKKREEGITSDLERKLLAIWKDLLPVKKISVHDNFFYLGGDSIIAIKLVSQARQRNIAIDVNQVFSFPTIYELAKSIQQSREIDQKPLTKESCADLYPFNQEYLKQIPKDRGALDAYPLSPMQEAFVYMDFSQKSQESNFIQNTYEIKGKIDSEKLQNAWHDIFRKTAILRTGIYYDEKRGLLQYVCENLPLPWQYYDLSHENEKIKETKIEQILKKRAEKNFKIDQPPLVNLCVIKLADESHYLIVSYHHIILDGWCIPVLIEKLKEKYQEKIDQKETLPEMISTPYWVYIDWLIKQDKEKAKQFWKDQLEGFSEPTYLEVNREKRERNSHIYEDFKYLLTDKQTKDILSFAQANNVSLNSLMQVAWAFLIYHYTRKTDILFGVTVSGRSMDIPGIDEMLGLCINAVPLRIKIEGEEDFKSLLLKNQKNMANIQDYAYLSLAEVRKIATIKGEASLFDSIFVFENYPKIHNKKNGLEISFVSALSRGEYPLGITVVPGDKILFKFDFGTDHFSRIFIQNVAHTLEKIVMSLIEDRG